MILETGERGTDNLASTKPDKTVKWADRQTGRQTERQTDRQMMATRPVSEGEAGRQEERQTFR